MELMYPEQDHVHCYHYKYIAHIAVWKCCICGHETADSIEAKYIGEHKWK